MLFHKVVDDLGGVGEQVVCCQLVAEGADAYSFLRVLHDQPKELVGIHHGVVLVQQVYQNVLRVRHLIAVFHQEHGGRGGNLRYPELLLELYQKIDVALFAKVGALLVRGQPGHVKVYVGVGDFVVPYNILLQRLDVLRLDLAEVYEQQAHGGLDQPGLEPL